MKFSKAISKFVVEDMSAQSGGALGSFENPQSIDDSRIFSTVGKKNKRVKPSKMIVKFKAKKDNKTVLKEEVDRAVLIPKIDSYTVQLATLIAKFNEFKKTGDTTKLDKDASEKYAKVLESITALINGIKNDGEEVVKMIQGVKGDELLSVR